MLKVDLKVKLVYYTTIKVYILQGKVSDMGNHTFDFRPKATWYVT